MDKTVIIVGLAALSVVCLYINERDVAAALGIAALLAAIVME